MNRQLRIRGLVSAYRQIKNQIGAGTAGNDLETRVRSITDTVESICAEHDTSPDALPVPSRNAYRYLKTLDAKRCAKLLARTVPQPRKPVASRSRTRGTVPVRNVVRLWHDCADEIWHRAEVAARRRPIEVRLRRKLKRLVHDVDGILSRRDATPASLATPSRNAWLSARLISDSQVFPAVIRSLVTANAVSEKHVPSHVNARVRLQVQRPLWRLKRQRGEALLTCHVGFYGAPTEVWDALFDASFGKNRRSSLVDDYSLSDPFGDVIRQLHALAGDTATVGVSHDLAESFSRVNHTFFDGTLEQPRLSWSRRATFRKFGHFDFVRDELVLSCTLDSSEVPGWVLDFVMYHELLHKKHGLEDDGSRRIAHTPAFREEERAYPRYEEAESFLTALARQVRAGSTPDCQH